MPVLAVNRARGNAFDRHQPRVAIIGAGLAGITVALHLQRIGHNEFTIYEKAAEPGGTWRVDDYPGATCDIPSHLCSMSFEPKSDWSRTYPRRAEILAYQQELLERRGLHDHLRLDTEITELRFEEARSVWRLSTRDDDDIEADVVVVCVGMLDRHLVPQIAGLDDFDGPLWHAREWDHDHELADERVAVVGTDATAIRFAPEIAPFAGTTTIYQRTPPSVVSRNDRPYVRWRQWMYRHVPGIRCLHRAKLFLRHERSAFMAPGRRKDTPGHEAGDEPTVLSDDWYPTLQRPDVELVTEPIARVVGDGIVTADGIHRRADVIALGTHLGTSEITSPLKVFGTGGRTLDDSWSGGAETHLGLSVPGYPNMFMVTGPGTAITHNSMVFMIEAAADFTTDAIAHLAARGPGATVDVRPEVAAASYAELRDDLHWPGSTFAYWRRTRRFRPDDYLLG